MKKIVIFKLAMISVLALAGGALAASAQGTVTRPPQQSTSSSQSGKTSGSQSGRTNAQNSQPTKKLYSYSYFVTSNFGHWVKQRNVLPLVVTGDKNGNLSSRDRLDLYYLSLLIKNGSIAYANLFSINASDKFIVNVMKTLENFGVYRDKIYFSDDYDEYSGFIPGSATSMILFWTGSDILTGPIMFAEDSSTLTDYAKFQLYIIAQNMNSRESGWIVGGYTTRDTGTSSSHFALSQRMAEAVVGFLTNECGVRPDKLTVVAYGGDYQLFPESDWNNVVLIEEN